MSSIRHFADIAKTAEARAYLNRLADYADAHRREVASMPAWAREVAVDVRVPVSAKVEHDGLEVETWTSRRGIEMHRVHWLDGSSTQYDKPLDMSYVAWDFGGTVESH